jgi:hypothetical protein
MTVSEYAPLYGIDGEKYKIQLDGKYMDIYDFFDDYPQFELSEGYVLQLEMFSLATLCERLKNLDQKSATAYLRDLYDQYRQNGGNPLYWLKFTYENLYHNPQNYPPHLRSVLEKNVIEWIDNIDKAAFDTLDKFRIDAPLVETEAEESNFQVVKFDNRKDQNHFCKSMPLNIPQEHFKVFTIQESKNNQPFLTIAQLGLFIKRAFNEEKTISKQNFNCGPRDKLFIVKRFYEFYNIAARDYENTLQCKDKYVKLLTDNFTNWDYKSIKDNFGNKVKREW